MAAHAVHFAVVARYAVVNGGRDLFPGGRSLNEVGGWPTVAGIYTFFAVLAGTGWVTGAPRAAGRPRVRVIGHAATGLIAAMFVGVYLGQLPRSRWYAVPATAVAGAVTANVVAQRRRPVAPPAVTWAGEHPDQRPRLGDMLDSHRRQRFVGRAAEIEFFRPCLDAESPAFSVLYVHGPGGIGKSSLLDAFAVEAHRSGMRVVRLDARDLLPSPDGVRRGIDRARRDSIGKSRDESLRMVVLLDSYERLEALDDWILSSCCRNSLPTR